MHTETQPEETTPPWIEALGLQAEPADPVLGALLRLLAQAADAPMAALWITDGRQQHFAATHGLNADELAACADLAWHCFRARSGPPPAADATIHPQPGRSGSGAVRYFDARPIHRPDPGTEPSCAGLVCVLDRGVRTGEPRLQIALGDAVIAIESLLRLRADGQHEPVSGALARSTFTDMADREWRRAMRGLYPITIMVLALDACDELALEGQDALDRAIRAMALAAQYSIQRPGDVVCRYDTRHLVLMLPGTDSQGAAAAAERIRAGLAALQIPRAGGGTVTLSAVAQVVPAEALSRGNMGLTVEALMPALRPAQQSGGNRCVLIEAGRP